MTRKLLIITLIVFLSNLCGAEAMAQTGVHKYWFQIVDEMGKPITSGLTVDIQIATTGGTATIYSDTAATSKTNPVTGTITNGIVEFYYGATSCDVEIVGQNGMQLYTAVRTTHNRLLFHSSKNYFREPSPVNHIYFEDWHTGSMVAGHKIGETANQNDWLQTLTDGDTDAGDVTQVADDAAGGILTITTNDKAADGQELQMNGESFKLASGKPLFFEASAAIEDVSETNFFIGLAITDTAVYDGTSDRVGFEIDNDGNIDFLIEQDSTEYGGDTGIDADDASLATYSTTKDVYAFFWDGTDTVYGYVNGVLYDTYTDNASTILVPDDEALTPTIVVEAGGAAAETVWIDYIYIKAER